MNFISKSSKAMSMMVVLTLVLSMVLAIAVVSFSNSSESRIFAAAEEDISPIAETNSASEKYSYADKCHYQAYIPAIQSENNADITSTIQSVEAHNLLPSSAEPNIGIGDKVAIDTYIANPSRAFLKSGNGAKIYTGWQNGKKLFLPHLKQFAASSSNENTKYDNYQGFNTIGETSIYYRNIDKQNKGHMKWAYFYGYIQLAQDLTENGGKLTVTADTWSVANNHNVKRFLSVVAGTGFVNNNDGTAGKPLMTDAEARKSRTLRASDIVMNNETGRTHCMDGLYKLDDRAYVSSSAEAMRQEVTIDICPGDKYIRVSYISLFKRDGGVSSNVFGQRLDNVNISYELTAIDKNAPVIGNVKGNDTPSTSAGKDITFTVDDEAKDGLTVTADKNIAVTNVEGNKYSIHVRENGTYTITAKDKYGNTSNQAIKVSNCSPIKVTAGGSITFMKNGAEVKVLDAEVVGGKFDVIVRNHSFGQRITGLQEVANVTISEVYNIGTEAKYRVTLGEGVPLDVNIEESTAPINMRVVAKMNKDGIITEDYDKELPFGYATGNQFTANTVDGMTFIGWYNEYGTLITTNTEVNFTVTAPLYFEKRYISNEGLQVTFQNLAGRTIDVKTRATLSPNETLIDAVSNLGVTAPANPFMTFKEWKVVSGENTNNVVVKASYETTGDFTVTVNYADGTKKLFEHCALLKLLMAFFLLEKYLVFIKKTNLNILFKNVLLV